MDCEKFESTLIDELYDELDEVTSAAAKRHVGGCVRCATMLSGLRATRRVATLPIVEPPPELEERILAAAREAQRVVPFRRRASRAISWAGSWAMRPQTAMAALFLLMIGSSALLLKGKQAAAPRSAMTVSEQGEPVPSAMTGTLERPSGEPGATVAAAAPQPTSAAVSPVAASDSRADAVLDGFASKSRANAPAHVSPRSALKEAAPKARMLDSRDDDMEGSQPLQHYAYAPGAAGGAPAPPAPLAPAPAPARAAPAAAQPAQTASGLATYTSGSGFGGAMAAYNAGDYATATALFDSLAAAGDVTSALWAARSVRKASGCAAAASRFDQVARSGSGTTTGYDATFEGGQCYKQLGQTDAAQARFRSLITVPSYVDRAKNELAQLAPKASAKPQAAQARGWSQPPQSAPQQQPTPASPSANKVPTDAN